MTSMTQLLEPSNIKSEKGVMVENSQCYKHSEKELGSLHLLDLVILLLGIRN